MLSIIIPIYNSELYLKECLDSLVSQTCKEFEVILVDDGSTDCSVKLCDLYCSVYSNFRYFYQSNEGPSAARNTGLKHVAGEFISFIDSDDYVANDYVETILGNMKYDILFFGILLQQNKGISKLSTFNDSSKTTLFELFMTQSDDCGYAFMVSKCFRKDLIMSNNLQFDENLHHFEDQLFTLEYMKKCERINSISKSLYFYNYGIGISSINPELNDFKNINIKLSKVLREYNDENVVNLRRVLERIAEKYQTSTDTIVYAWLLKHPVKGMVICGSQKISRLQNAINALQINLELEEWYEIYLASGQQILR